MLKGIVEHNDLGRIGQGHQLANADDALFGHGHLGKGAVSAYLKGFVADVGRRVLRIGEQIAARSAPVAARKHGHAVTLFVEQMQQVFDVGRFARAAHCNIAHANEGYPETLAFEQAIIEKLVTHEHDQTP
ncbi:unknown [Prevotella sp. CAG:891]|nr:unknown [Prevotella sp. CAG:891]